MREMDRMGLGVVERRFADMIWDNEPLGSGELVKLCLEELHWKKSTTYTVLKKLCDKGLFINEGGQVRALIAREDYKAQRSAQFVSDTYGGSLPAFIAAFTERKALSAEDAARIKEMIDNYAE